MDGSRDFSPLVKLAMRMGWISNIYINNGAGLAPTVMPPFSYVAAWECPNMDIVYVFGVVNGRGMCFEEPRTLFPSDGFIGRLKLLS